MFDIEDLIEQIETRLKAVPELYGTFTAGEGWDGYATGGIWSRNIKREGPGATTEAFRDSDGVLMIRPCIALRDGGESDHLQYRSIPQAINAQIWVYFYAPALASGKLAIKNMRRVVTETIDHRFSDWIPEVDEGVRAFIELVDRRGRHDSETFPEAVEDYQRYVVTTRRAALV